MPQEFRKFVAITDDDRVHQVIPLNEKLKCNKGLSDIGTQRNMLIQANNNVWYVGVLCYLKSYRKNFSLTFTSSTIIHIFQVSELTTSAENSTIKIENAHGNKYLDKRRCWAWLSTSTLSSPNLVSSNIAIKNLLFRRQQQSKKILTKVPLKQCKEIKLSVILGNFNAQVWKKLDLKNITETERSNLFKIKLIVYQLTLLELSGCSVFYSFKH